jgi:HK97 family phage portal protein
VSLLRNLERRDYSPIPFVDPNLIPPNSDLGYSPLVPTGHGAMRHWAVWACARVIADAVSTLPVDLLIGSGTGAQPVDVLPQVLERPSAYADRVDWLSQVMVSLLTSGNAYGIIASRDRLEYPTQINLVAPGTITAMIDPDTGQKVYKNNKGDVLNPSLVWHRTGLVWPGEVVGLDPVTYFARTITLGMEAERYGSDYYTKGAHPTAVATTDQEVNREQAETIKDRIRKSVAGRDIAVLGAGLKLEPWQGSPNEAQLIEMIHLNAAMVCAIYGVPPEKIGISGHSKGSVTYANREQRAQDFLLDAVNPWLVRLERSMSEWFPRNKFVKFNTGGFLKSDLKTRFDAYAVATAGKPWMLPSEARSLENWAPAPGIDDTIPTAAPNGPMSGNGTQPPGGPDGGNPQG